MEEINFRTSQYWLIVVDGNSFKNASLHFTERKTKEEIILRFEEKFPRYKVIEVGEGKENRPEAFRDLVYIDEQKSEIL